MRKKKEAKNKLYFMMNKAPGAVCSTVSDSHVTVYQCFEKSQLISEEGARLHTVGRLDKDTEGLLFLTNDGRFSNYLTRPENKIQKTYFVRLKNPVSPEEKKLYAQKALEGVELPAEKKAPVQKSGSAVISWETELSQDSIEPKLLQTADKTQQLQLTDKRQTGQRAQSILPDQPPQLQDSTECCITLTEGKFHEVKRLFASLGNEVIYLKRVKMGGVALDEGLQKGQWRCLSEEELKRLFPDDIAHHIV